MSARGHLPALVLGLLISGPPVLASTPPGRPAAAEDIRDIRGPVSIPLWWRWWALAGGAAGVAGLAIGAARQWRRRRSRPLTPSARALERLAEAQRLAAAGQARDYAVAASDAVRSYIEESFGLRAAQLTTEEFFRDLVEHERPALGGQRDSLIQFLGACDLAKFARLEVPREGLTSLNELARHFVLTTARPASEPPPSPKRAS